MGFRFRKSFKLMPGVRVNLSTKGLSTTIGGRGASVNISSRGTYLNTSIPGTGISSRQRIGSRNGNASRPVAYTTPAPPATPQPASTRWFSFGVAFAVFGIFSVISAYQNQKPDKPISLGEAFGFALFWVAFGATWWFVRRARRRAKQARYEQYVAKQAAEQQALQDSIVEAQRQRQVEVEQAAENERNQREEREKLRLASYEPQLERARLLCQEGILTDEQLAKFEDYPKNTWSSVSGLESEINFIERTTRAEMQRQQTIRGKYDATTADRLIARLIIPGTTREQLTDALGTSSKMELATTKAGVRETHIYGNKTSGSYFHVVNGIVTKAVVR